MGVRSMTTKEKSTVSILTSGLVLLAVMANVGVALLGDLSLMEKAVISSLTAILVVVNDLRE